MTDLLTSPPQEPPAVPNVPTESIWRVRIRLAWDTLIKNWALFRSNVIGLIGIALILMFGFMAALHPVLISGLGFWNGVSLFLLTWPVAAFLVMPLMRRLQANRRASLSVTAVVAVLVVIGIGVSIGDKWDSATYHPIVGYESNPQCDLKLVVDKDQDEIDPATEMSRREAVLNNNVDGLPAMIGDMVEVCQQPQGPYGRHWLGTDPLGRDVLSQLMKGSQAAFLLGSIAALVTVFIATAVGSIAAYFIGWIDSTLMRLADLLLMLPALALLIVLSAVLEFELWHLAMFIGLLNGFGGVAIVLKSQALAVSVKPYIDAAKVSGGGSGRVIFTHIVPNVMPLSFLYMMFGVTAAIQTEATLSFLGLLNADMSWGLMMQLAQNQGYFLTGSDFYWLVFPAGLAVTLISAAFFLVGRAMDEVINPRLRRR